MAEPSPSTEPGMPAINQRTVAVLGGNAFVRPGEALTMAGQFRFAAQALTHLEPLLVAGGELLLSHGNGPQVGHILVRVEEALGKSYSIPLEVCVAESEGELGYVLEQSLHNLLSRKEIRRPIASLLTQVVVSAEDPAFDHPEKPIGPVYSASEAQKLTARGFQVKRDGNRGLRRVVASPRPTRVVDGEVIRTLLTMGVLVIAAGGGGIPVIERDGQLHGVEAVIDKDRTAALLADYLDAELLIILTGVPCAYLHFATPRQEPIGRIGVDEARRLVAEGHFGTGTMLPKIESAIDFADRPGRRVIICDPPSLEAALVGKAGTRVEPD